VPKQLLCWRIDVCAIPFKPLILDILGASFVIQYVLIYIQLLLVIYALCCYLIYQSFNRPLDLCDTITSSPDILPVGYPGSHTNVLTLPNHHGSLGPTLPTSNMNARLPGSPGMVLGSSLPSPSTLNAPSR
jgi:hypothetical protein